MFTTTCPDCGVVREVVKGRCPVRRCRSCSQQKAQRGRKLGSAPERRQCKATGCESWLKKNNGTGYCYKCWHANVDNIKSNSYKAYYYDPDAQLKSRRNGGLIITDEQWEKHCNATHCDWCERPLTSKNKALDHCHATGHYRGTLCKRCNGALGNLGDDFTLIAERLQRYRLQ